MPITSWIVHYIDFSILISKFDKVLVLIEVRSLKTLLATSLNLVFIISRQLHSHLKGGNNLNIEMAT